MNCKECKNEFEVIHIDGEDYEYCSTCQGLLLHKDQLNKLLKETSEDVELHSIKEYCDDQKGQMTCPVCSSKMKKINFLGFSGITLDHCESCGAFWLDKGEISQMHELIKMVEEGKHSVPEVRAYNFLTKLSEIAYSVFH